MSICELVKAVNGKNCENRHSYGSASPVGDGRLFRECFVCGDIIFIGEITLKGKP
jgi:hypothetical protein